MNDLAKLFLKQNIKYSALSATELNNIFCNFWSVLFRMSICLYYKKIIPLHRFYAIEKNIFKYLKIVFFTDVFPCDSVFRRNSLQFQIGNWKKPSNIFA